MTQPAIFLDKDGTLIEDVPYNVDPRHIRLMRGAADALRLLAGRGYRLFVVTNQPGVAHGIFREEELQPVWLRLNELLAPHGINLAGLYYCPHHPQGVVSAYARACDCRKPAPGLLRRAAEEHGLDLRRSWMIGDTLNDVEAGNRAGCRTVLLANGGETLWELSPQRMPHLITTDLAQAARRLLTRVRPSRRFATQDRVCQPTSTN